jgi:hypothetical protein
MSKIYRIIDSRDSGKTSRLMLLAKENNGVLVCNDPYSMRNKAYAYGLVGFDIISYQDYLNDNYDTTKPCFIDELELLIKRGLGKTFNGYSLSQENE